MIKRLSKSSKSVAALPADYAPLLADIKARVQAARIKAGLAANRELLALYWDIGRLIVVAQRTQGYGKQVVERLAADVQCAFPGISGFSALNVWRMRAFYTAYATTILSPPVTESAPPEPFASLPWSHNLLLLQKLEKPADRLWYAAKAVERGWSRNVLALQIDSGLHTRQGKAVTNFKATLPPAHSDLAQQITKDPYLFDFLTLRDDANERAVEVALLGHVEKFLLELGAGFALVGRQVHMEVGDQDFYLDLLFYHLTLRCFVVIDLKARDFTPEAAGKMNFYLSAVDDRFCQPGDQPSIGLILCRSKNRVIAEYALRDLTKPIGVSGYVTKWVESLPKALKGAVPSVEELEKEFTKQE
ncbi:MAG: PDDEXK nuclease domain-containing protein [Opitutaceae bacterium]|jgi:predicted nuclease of restriction endonuclease-like (RecB) superfamily